MLLYFLLVPMISFVVQDADWKVAVENVHLFAVGSYPADQLWRIFLNVVLLMGLIGTTVATQTTMGIKSWGLFVFFMGCGVWIAVDYANPDRGGLNAANHYFLIAGLGVYLLGYYISKRMRFPRAKFIVSGWFLY
ncbi:MAG: hypothetical protein ACE5HN_10370, partial [Nitrospiria bacterium]